MTECQQTDTQNVLEHGLSVFCFTQRLIAGDWGEMKIPECFAKNFQTIKENLFDLETIRLYNIYHDCGKPFCITYDEKGKHFPNHAEISYTIFKKCFNNENAANLVKDDMILHTATAEEIKCLNWPKQHYSTLIITALAELHANAQMFGGIESISFKIKFKKLEQRIKQYIKSL